MQLPGPGVFGPPKDRAAAIAVLRRAVESGVDHIDTAQFYGPDVANELIHAALHPYPEELVLVSKVGAARDDNGSWMAAQRPEELRAGVEANLKSLEIDQVPVVNRVFGPDPDEVVFARKVIDAFAKAERSGSASITVDGVFVDYPIVYKAERIVALAESIAGRQPMAKAP